MVNLIDRNKLVRIYRSLEEIDSTKAFLKEYLTLASKICGTSDAYISLLDDEKQYSLFKDNTELDIIPREQAICSYTMQRKDILIIEDAKSDERTKHLDSVTQGKWSFYAGIPLINDEGYCIGAFCIIDKNSKNITEEQVDILKILAQQIMSTLDNQRSLIDLIKKINTNFKPADCADIYCLQGELAHLSNEVVKQNDIIREQKVRLEEVNDSLSTFAHVTAHDLRAPLRTIKSFVQLMEKDLSQNAVDFNKEYMSFIKNGVKDMDQFILDLLTLAKAGHDDGSQELISIINVLELVKSNLKKEIDETRATIIFPDDDLLINCNKTKIIQLVQNIISNGIKYHSDERIPEIKVTAKKVKDSIHITIADNGIGMDNVDEIFKPFTRLNTGGNFEGSGIGLATCKRVLDSMNANYSVQSELGKGTTFYFDFPDSGKSTMT